MPEGTEHQSDLPLPGRIQGIRGCCRKHDLIRLADEAGVLNACSNRQKAFLSTPTEFCIEARHPGDRLKLGDMCNREFSEMLLAGAEEMIEWLRSQLRQ